MCTYRPRGGDKAQRFDIDLGVNPRGVRLTVTKDLPDFCERGPVPEQIGRQRMAKKVRAFVRRAERVNDFDTAGFGI